MALVTLRVFIAGLYPVLCLPLPAGRTTRHTSIVPDARIQISYSQTRTSNSGCSGSSRRYTATLLGAGRVAHTTVRGWSM
jgi:hypothetical protein